MDPEPSWLAGHASETEHERLLLLLSWKERGGGKELGGRRDRVGCQLISLQLYLESVACESGWSMSGRGCYLLALFSLGG
jgi:hypothetical protein